MRLTFDSPPKSLELFLSLLCLMGLLSAICSLSSHSPPQPKKPIDHALTPDPPSAKATPTPPPSHPQDPSPSSRHYHIAGTETTTPAATMPLTPFPGRRGAETWRRTMLLTAPADCASPRSRRGECGYANGHATRRTATHTPVSSADEATAARDREREERLEHQSQRQTWEEILVVTIVKTANGTWEGVRDDGGLGRRARHLWPVGEQRENIAGLCWTWGYRAACDGATSCVYVELTRLFGRLLQELLE